MVEVSDMERILWLAMAGGKWMGGWWVNVEQKQHDKTSEIYYSVELILGKQRFFKQFLR